MKAWKNAEKPPEGLHEKERIEALDTRKRDNVFHDRNDIFTIKEKGKQVKWRLVVYDKGQKAVLECYDAGVLTKNCLYSWTDNYPYVDGSIAMDGVEVHLRLKLSAMNAYGGLPCSEYGASLGCKDVRKLWDVLPANIAIQYVEPNTCDNSQRTRDRDRNTVRLFPKNMTPNEIKKRFRKIEMWVSDPRILLLAYSVSTDSDAGLWKRLSSPIPSRAKAIETLKHYGLWKPFSPEMRVTDCFYDLLIAFLNEMYCKFSPEKQEILKAVNDAVPRLPLQEIPIAGVFAINDKDYVLRALNHKLKGAWGPECIPVTFEREPKNAHDPNAIRVKCVISGEEYKLGYIPKVYAEKFAPMMDKGVFLNGAIGKDGIEGQEIKLKVTCRKGTGAFDRLSIVWGSIFKEWHEAEIDAAARTLTYVHRERYFSGKETQLKLTFSPDAWEDFALPTLMPCAFKEWSHAYRSLEQGEVAHLWRMVIQKGDKEHRSYGYSRYPIEWHLWQDFIKACLDFNDPKGSAVITVKEKRI